VLGPQPRSTPVSPAPGRRGRPPSSPGAAAVARAGHGPSWPTGPACPDGLTRRPERPRRTPATRDVPEPDDVPRGVPHDVPPSVPVPGRGARRARALALRHSVRSARPARRPPDVRARVPSGQHAHRPCAPARRARGAYRSGPVTTARPAPRRRGYRSPHVHDRSHTGQDAPRTRSAPGQDEHPSGHDSGPPDTTAAPAPRVGCRGRCVAEPPDGQTAARSGTGTAAGVRTTTVPRVRPTAYPVTVATTLVTMARARMPPPRPSAPSSRRSAPGSTRVR